MQRKNILESLFRRAYEKLLRYLPFRTHPFLNSSNYILNSILQMNIQLPHKSKINTAT